LQVGQHRSEFDHGTILAHLSDSPPMRRRPLPLALVLVTSLLAACSSDDDATPDPTTTSTPAASTTTIALEKATFVVQPGTKQVAITGAEPGDELRLLDATGDEVATGTVDEQGALLFRNVTPGDGYTVANVASASPAVRVADSTDIPDAGFYADQPLLPAGGFGYITTRDGTTLSANVMLPGPADGGPYPTVVEYSGYSPSNPDDTTFGTLFNALGFAYVGVNMRGSGCSGGSFRFFEEVQNLDGYDVIEAVAAQPWVSNNKVGMVGISYPGISQLFVAQTQPPSLEAITPLSVLDDSYRATLYPGGVLNTGFAVDWTQQRVDSTKPFGQEWSKQRADAGDTRCADNQVLRLQNPDLVAEIDDNPFYSNPLGDSLAPITFVDKIDVPVFLAGAWQDEQTGGHFPVMLDGFTSAPQLYVTLMNGLHTESLSPPVLARMVEFLDLYVKQAVPDVSPLTGIAGILGQGLYGVNQFAPFTNRFEGQTFEQAKAAFEAEPKVRVLLEQGGNAAFTPGTPEPNAVLEFPSWPIPDTTVRSWFLGDDNTLQDAAPAAEATATYRADPSALPPTFFTGDDSNSIWRADTTYDWRPIPDGTGLAFVSAPLTRDTVLVGPASLDLWVGATTPDTDIEATISEVRPDGTEIFVQSGVLRASHRALDTTKATETWAAHTNFEDDAAPLPEGELTALRVDILSFVHAFRAGSSLRVTIDAPGNNRPVWAFRTISDGEDVTVGWGGATPSRLVVSEVPVASLPPVPPACGSLRGQPCRPNQLPAPLG
jgi:predicted acyl esterase